jgi:hypothetical protein
MIRDPEHNPIGLIQPFADYQGADSSAAGATEMSYLNALRLHFSGQFQANVSTVNNDPGHFDNGAFLSSYQDMQGPNMQPPNGWFNPQGDAAFRLLGCTITTAWTPSGQVGSSDPVLGYIIADSDDRVPAKLVDLDPEQQMVSTIWSLKVRIADASGNTLVQGKFKPAAFMTFGFAHRAAAVTRRWARCGSPC